MSYPAFVTKVIVAVLVIALFVPSFAWAASGCCCKEVSTETACPHCQSKVTVSKRSCCQRPRRHRVGKVLRHTWVKPGCACHSKYKKQAAQIPSSRERLRIKKDLFEAADCTDGFVFSNPDNLHRVLAWSLLSTQDVSPQIVLCCWLA